MRYFERVDGDIDVSSLSQQLSESADLWGHHSFRLQESGPFYGTSDIWVRYRDEAELTEPAKYRDQHFSKFWPAWELLPAVQPIVWRLMRVVQATNLGGILITRIPAGGRVKPHHDRGGWHAEFYSRKIYVPIQTNPHCENICEDESVTMGTGDAWWFDNQVTHSVENRGKEDRVTLIVCMSTK